MTFGEIVKKAREGRFSQKDLGEQIGVWDTYVGQIEKGDKIPSDEICIRLARALELDERRLLLLAYRERASNPINSQAIFGRDNLLSERVPSAQRMKS